MQEYLLMEAAELLKCPTLLSHANRSGENDVEQVIGESPLVTPAAMGTGFAGCVFRYLTQYTEPHKRVRSFTYALRSVQ